MAKKLVDFQTSISDIKVVNPEFSSCRIRVLYTGRNRNMSSITKDAVEKALPTIIGIPIVGEFNESIEDFKGHGGSIDLDSYKFIHTTKAYGYVPESATYEWQTVEGSDGSTRQYLTIEGCRLWTGRYPEAYSVIESGKGQSMEINVTEGQWLEEEEIYQIDNFTFSGLCILGDDVEPAFEDANITAYSLGSERFAKEFSEMKQAAEKLAENNQEVNEMLKELLIKYSTTMKVLNEKGLVFENIADEDLEGEIAKALEVDVITEEDLENQEDQENKEDQENLENQEDLENKENLENQEDLENQENKDNKDPLAGDGLNSNGEDLDNQENPENKESNAGKDTKEEVFSKEDVKALEDRIETLEAQLEELETLKKFKADIEKQDHENKVQELFSDFQFVEEDVKDLDIHAFSYEEIEEKCYVIFGKKAKGNKNFSKKQEEGSNKLPLLNNNSDQDEPKVKYGGILKKSN